MKRLRRKIRISALNVIKSIGIFDAWRRIHRHDIAILMFHGTADPKRPSIWTPLRQQFSPEYLDWSLSLLKDYYQFITLDEAVSILKGEKPPLDYGLVFTFDDGYRSNIEDALPIFRKHGAPMSIFITVSNVDNRKPLWFDRLDYALQNAVYDGHRFKIGSRTIQIKSLGTADLVASYAKFRKMIKKELRDEIEFASKIDEVIMYYEQSNGKTLGKIFETDPWSALLKWEEVLNAQDKDVHFGSHTMDHYRVGNLNKKMLDYQFSESKKRIENKTGKDCKYIAYPDDSFSDEAAFIAHQCGYQAALTTIEGINQIGCNIMKLKRICIPLTTDSVELLAYVSGFSKAISIYK